MPDNTYPSKVLCRCCNTNITESMALTEEGKDYIYHFCGEKCLIKWQKKPPADNHDKKK